MKLANFDNLIRLFGDIAAGLLVYAGIALGAWVFQLLVGTLPPARVAPMPEIFDRVQQFIALLNPVFFAWWISMSALKAARSFYQSAPSAPSPSLGSSSPCATTS